jgi:hypothetical protein
MTFSKMSCFPALSRGLVSYPTNIWDRGPHFVGCLRLHIQYILLSISWNRRIYLQLWGVPCHGEKGSKFDQYQTKHWLGISNISPAIRYLIQKSSA